MIFFEFLPFLYKLWYNLFIEMIGLFYIGGVIMYDSNNNPFPHDGEHEHSCTGYGCDCEEKYFGSGGGGSSGGGNSTKKWIITLVVCSIICGFNELLGGIIFIVVAFFLFMDS